MLAAMTEGPQERAARADRILADAGAIIAGDHFVYINGDHGDGWIAKDAIFPNTEWVSVLCGMLAEALASRRFDIVCGPATGGLIVSQWTAHHLGLPAVFAEHGKEQGYDPATAAPGPLRPPFVLKRGYDQMVAGRRVLIVDDVVNTGESISETAATVRAAGGEVVAAAAKAGDFADTFRRMRVGLQEKFPQQLVEANQTHFRFVKGGKVEQIAEFFFVAAFGIRAGGPDDAHSRFFEYADDIVG